MFPAKSCPKQSIDLEEKTPRRVHARKVFLTEQVSFISEYSAFYNVQWM
jgi:hypothetical protein